MNIRFAYDIDADVKNYIVASQSVNSSARTKMQELYVARYGESFEADQLKQFIRDITAERNLHPEEDAERIERNWRSIEQEALRRIESIFAIPSPAETMTVYVTTDSRCSYNTEGNYFFVSTSRSASNLTILHELFHFWTWWTFGEEVGNGRLTDKQYNNIKESLTVILNLEFADLMDGAVDAGYPQHQKMREAIRETWMKTKSISGVFEMAKRMTE